MKLYIFTSKSRKDLGDWIEDHTFQVMVAISQLYAFPTGPRFHWRQEVWEKFDRMKLFRHNKKLPDAKFILENSWEVNKGFVDSALNYAIDKETDYIPKENLDISELTNIIEQYFIWLADELSKKPAVRLESVLKKLDELGLKA